MPAKSATHIDRFIGKKIYEIRKQAGLSQEKLGAKIGVSFQQVQKYENGANRISACRLHQLAKAFRLPVAVFFPKE